MEWKEFGIELHNFIVQSLEDDNIEEPEEFRIPRKSPEELDWEWLEKLCDIAMSDRDIDTKNKLMLQYISIFPRFYLRSRYGGRRLNFISELKEMLQAFKIFVSYYGQFNESKYKGFLDFTEIASHLFQKEIINHLRLVDSNEFKFLLEITIVRSTINFYNTPSNRAKFYRKNSLFRFLFEIIISKVGNPHDLVQNEVQNLVKTIKDNLKNYHNRYS